MKGYIMSKKDNNGIIKDKTYKELDSYAKEHGKTMKEVVLSDEQLENVTAILYKHLPKIIQWAQKKETFQNAFKMKREEFAAHLPE